MDNNSTDQSSSDSATQRSKRVDQLLIILSFFSWIAIFAMLKRYWSRRKAAQHAVMLEDSPAEDDVVPSLCLDKKD